MSITTPKDHNQFWEKPDFIESGIISLLVDIETKDGKTKRVTYDRIKELRLSIYRHCDASHLKSMISMQLPDYSQQQFAALCDLAWYGSDYQSMLEYLNPGSGKISDFRGGFAQRAFVGEGSKWIVEQYAITAMKAESSKKEWMIAPTEHDWSRIVSAYLNISHWSNNFDRTGLAFAELLNKCCDQYILKFLGEYDALADDQSFETVFKLKHLSTPERIWINSTQKPQISQFTDLEYSTATPDQLDVLAVLKNGLVLTKSKPGELSKAA